MNPVWILVWSSATSPTSAQEAALRSYATARWLQLSPAKPSAPEPVPYAAAVARRIESALEQARLQSASLQDEAATQALQQARALLKGNPSLPQAAWLLAEVLRIEAGVQSRSETPEVRAAAMSLWQQAQALDGGRAAGFGESVDRAVAGPLAALPVHTLRVVGTEHADLYVNGVLQPSAPEPRQLQLSDGTHHLRVLRLGVERWAGWVEIGADTRRIDIPSTGAARCSAEEFHAVRRAPDAAESRAAVTCERWLQARAAPGPATLGAIQLRSCEGPDCGAWLIWDRDSGKIFSGPAQVIEGSEWPDWASYLLAGVGLAAASGFVLWQVGAFDSPAKGREGWIYQAPASLSF